MITKSTKEKNTSNNFIASIKILLFQSQIFGLVTFDYTEKHFHPSQVKCVYSFVAFFCYLILGISALYRTVTTENTSIVYKSTDLLIVLINCAYIGSIVIAGLVKRTKFITLLHRIIEFDNKLQSTDINYGKIRKRIIFRMVVRYTILFFLISFLLTYVMLNIDYHETLALGSSFVIMIVNSAVCHQLAELILIIKSRFAILNKQISKLIIAFRRYINTIETSNFMKLTKICSLHHNLSKLIKIFNEIFGVILLFMFAVSFVAIVLSLFYCAAELQASRITWLNFFWSFALSLSFVLDTIYVCDCCYGTIEEVNNSNLYYKPRNCYFASRSAMANAVLREYSQNGFRACDTQKFLCLRIFLSNFHAISYSVFISRFYFIVDINISQ